ncbi:MAG TPA: ABC transporter permease [Chitinophagaceae bacterium]|jgi:putative ABC transport system permease protein|nr:ABC transporter permease [Chitinophagaceae bacterium]
MITNYLKLAVRNLTKRKGYSLLNISGLAIGIACCLLIFQYVAYEKSFDGFPDKANQIVRLRLDSYQQGKLSWKSATSYPAFGPTMKKDFPEVEDYCRLIDADMLLSNDEKNVKFNENKGYYADPSFLSMFNIDLVKGNPKTALNGPDKLLLSEETAKKYFGQDDPIGKKLVYRDPNFTRTLEVTGIFKEYPSNSHLIINHLASYSTLGSILRRFGDTTNATETSWGWYDFYTYLQLKPNTDLKKFESKFPAFCNRYMNNRDWAKANNVVAEIHILPLRDIHLYSNYNQEAEVNGNGQAVSFLFLIAFLIIGIAWINYINLATARSLERAREVGVRKVVGAIRRNLIIQFLVESLLLNLIALLLAAVIVFLLAPWFNQLTGRTGSADLSTASKYWLLFAAMFIGGSILSGLYPAFVLSGFKPVSVLKGLFKNSAGGFLLRKGLIITQFATSVVLIAGTIIVFQQVNFMRKQQLGVNINQTLVLDGANSIPDSLYQNAYQPFKTALLQQPGIQTVSSSSSVMGKEIYWTNGSKRLTTDAKGSVTLYNIGVDYDFIPSFDLQIKAGRNFSKDFPTDNNGVLLNESAARLLGFEDFSKAINEKFFSAGDTVTLLGIVSNYHHQGLQKAIDPMIFRLRPNARTAYSIKIKTGDVQATIGSIQKTWSKFFPADPLNYYFLDESFNQQYKADQQFGKIFALFAFLAIIIACFGLLGLSAYNVLQRTKEIGIRKVLGASIQNVLYILSKDFILLVLIAFVIAIPVTWWIMYNWLQDFAYRINIQLWVFGVAGLLAILIALLTISSQALKAAVSNPVKSLRTE